VAESDILWLTTFYKVFRQGDCSLRKASYDELWYWKTFFPIWTDHPFQASYDEVPATSWCQSTAYTCVHHHACAIMMHINQHMHGWKMPIIFSKAHQKNTAHFARYLRAIS